MITDESIYSITSKITTIPVGMFEHVGPKNYPAYFAAIERVITLDGLFLLHTIGCNYHPYTPDAWLDKYIFPNGYLPSTRQPVGAIERDFTLEDWHNFGLDYDTTLMAWWKNFNAAWPHYLNACASYFRSRLGLLWQLVLSKRTRRAIYRSIR